MDEIALEKLGFKKLDTVDLINDEADEQFLLDDAIRSGEVDYILHAFKIVTRSRNKRNLAKEAGISRATFYKALDGKSKPSAETVFALFKALNITLVPEFK